MEQQAAFFLKYLPMKISFVSLETAILPAYLGYTLCGAIGQALHCDLPAYNYLYNNKFGKSFSYFVPMTSIILMSIHSRVEKTNTI